MVQPHYNCIILPFRGLATASVLSRLQSTIISSPSKDIKRSSSSPQAFQESPNLTIENETTVIVTTNGDVFIATIDKRSVLRYGPMHDNSIYLSKNLIQVSAHQHVTRGVPQILYQQEESQCPLGLYAFRGGPGGKVTKRDKDDNRLVNIIWATDLDSRTTRVTEN